ncbi:hypothetical protein [Mycobacterium sp.]|uniref:hypothetical protein n=1 Tax=Mycobacterium sp. TaxID=1785 RepID=UPI002D86B373|nr:hypothetical protein [Mycobacterium sp.]
MRIAGLIATSLLVAGCSQSGGGNADRIEPIPSTSSATSPSRPSTTPPTSTKPASPPKPGAPIGALITWIESGTSADAGAYHSATRDGATTELGDDVAFTTPSGKTNCMTDGGTLACLVDLADPPPRPTEVYGEWKGGWVDFEGPTLQVGSAHGDPGRFTAGTGPEMPYGQALAFGDYRCRADPAGLFCVNYAHQSGAWFSDAGIEPFGCLQKVTPPADVGLRFSC